jgi:hypothetical protein
LSVGLSAIVLVEVSKRPFVFAPPAKEPVAGAVGEAARIEADKPASIGNGPAYAPASFVGAGSVIVGADHAWITADDPSASLDDQG